MTLFMFMLYVAGVYAQKGDLAAVAHVVYHGVQGRYVAAHLQAYVKALYACAGALNMLSSLSCATFTVAVAPIFLAISSR